MSNEVRKLPKIQKVDDTNNGSDKKKKCPYCGFYMSSTEKVCPTCGQKYHSPVYPVVVLIVLVLSILSISSCMKSCTSSADTTTSSENTLVTTSTIMGIESSNPLMSCDIIVIDILNGSMDNVIGQRAEIHTTKDIVENLSMEEFHEFVESKVLNHGYSWFTINYDDGSGICFAGAKTSVIEYGTLDQEGRINTVLQDINYNDVPTTNNEVGEVGNDKILDLLKDTYTREIESFDNVKIEYNSEINTYVIYATKSGASETLQLIKHGYEDSSIWTDVVSAITLQVISSCIQAHEIDENASIMFNLLNDLDETKTLLSIMNGNVLYNALDE